MKNTFAPSTTTAAPASRCPFHHDAKPKEQSKKSVEDDESVNTATTTSSNTDHELVVSTLTNKRGSDGMGLPTELSLKTIEIVDATAAAVAPKSVDITKSFYETMFGKHKELLAYFNPAHNVPVSTHQPKALAASVVAYASNIKDLTPLLDPKGPVMAICHRHCALNVFPEQYQVVHDNLMKSIATVLGPGVATPEIANAWSEAVLFLAKLMIDTEEQLYQMAEHREGGWSGPMEFVVSDIVDRGNNIKSFSFKPPTGSSLDGSHFEFTPGQYLSLQVDYLGPDQLTAPRHYTVTSPPGEDYLQCTIKKIPGGRLSTYVHENLKVGDKVMLTAPYGIFTVDEDDEQNIDSAVLMSAGVGVTPMVNIQRKLAEKVQLVVHVDKTESDHAFRYELGAATGGRTLTKYTQKEGRVDAKTLVGETLEKLNGTTDHTFFICGPERWMADVQSELLALGAKEVRCEAFGSQLATSCPFQAKSPTTQSSSSSSSAGRCPFAH